MDVIFGYPLEATLPVAQGRVPRMEHGMPWGAGQQPVPPLLFRRDRGSSWEPVLAPVRGDIGGPQAIQDPVDKLRILALQLS